MSLTRVLASLKCARREQLARERAGADAARYQMADAEERLAAVRAQHEEARRRLDRLGSAPGDYAAMLTEKERHLTDSGDPRRATLLSLADERGRLTTEIAEIRTGLRDAASAQQALLRLRDILRSAKGWNTYDTFFGGGLLADLGEHSRLDDAARAAREQLTTGSAQAQGKLTAIEIQRRDLLSR